MKKPLCGCLSRSREEWVQIACKTRCVRRLFRVRRGLRVRMRPCGRRMRPAEQWTEGLFPGPCCRLCFSDRFAGCVPGLVSGCFFRDGLPAAAVSGRSGGIRSRRAPGGVAPLRPVPEGCCPTSRSPIKKDGRESSRLPAVPEGFPSENY